MAYVVKKHSISYEQGLLTAGWPIPRSFATAEKLPFSTSLTNICIASNLSTRTSIPLWNRFYAKSNDSPACGPPQDRGQKQSFSLPERIPIRNSWCSSSCQICLQFRHINIPGD